jgi:hypothetical protein
MNRFSEPLTVTLRCAVAEHAPLRRDSILNGRLMKERLGEEVVEKKKLFN